MGVCYYVVCHDCKVCRDLDKYYAMLRDEDADGSREGMLKYAADEIVHGNSFRAALLVTFMGKHIGHKCTVVHEDFAYDMMNDEGYAEDFDYWANPRA